MKLLLTSGGITNDLLVQSLADLSAKPFSQQNLVFILTASNAEGGDKSFLLNDITNFKKLGFASVDLVDFAGLPSNLWQPRLEAADILVFGGGNTFHLMDQINRSGLKNLIPKLIQDKIYIGISAGSIVAGPDVSLAGWDPEWDQNIVNLTDTRGLDLVPFVISPHFDPEDLPLLRQKQSQVSYPVRPLADGQAIIVHNEHVRWVGVGSEVSL